MLALALLAHEPARLLDDALPRLDEAGELDALDDAVVGRESRVLQEREACQCAARQHLTRQSSLVAR